MGLETRGGGGAGEENKEKIPHMCGSIGYQRLWSRCKPTNEWTDSGVYRCVAHD